MNSLEKWARKILKRHDLLQTAGRRVSSSPEANANLHGASRNNALGVINAPGEGLARTPESKNIFP